MRRSLLITVAAMVMGSNVLPVAASSPPGFKLVLTSAQTAVPMGASEVDFTLWNEGSGEAVPITVTTSMPWASPTPASFLSQPGSNQPVAVTLAAGARGKAIVTFATAPGTIGMVRVIRAVASPIYVGITPPRPPVLPATGFSFVTPIRALGLVLAALILLRLAALIRRRRRAA